MDYEQDSRYQIPDFRRGEAEAGDKLGDNEVDKHGKRICSIVGKWSTSSCPHCEQVIHKVIHRVLHGFSRELFDNPPALLL